MHSKYYPNTKEEKIEHLRQWCIDNYEYGAATMAETWTERDFKDLLANYAGSFRRALDTLTRNAALYYTNRLPTRVCTYNKLKV